MTSNTPYFLTDNSWYPKFVYVKQRIQGIQGCLKSPIRHTISSLQGIPDTNLVSLIRIEGLYTSDYPLAAFDVLCLG